MSAASTPLRDAFAGTPARRFLALLALGAIAVSLVLIATPARGAEGPDAYQQHQSLIAIGSGQKTGRGEHATQTKSNYLPEHHSDVMFAVVGDRWDFAASAFALVLFALVVHGDSTDR
jgi:rod shape determining protein RodA